jgi:hypothetical protein
LLKAARSARGKPVEVGDFPSALLGWLRSPSVGEGVAAALSTSLTLCRKTLMSGKLSFLLSRSDVAEEEREGSRFERVASRTPFSTEEERRREAPLALRRLSRLSVTGDAGGVGSTVGNSR